LHAQWQGCSTKDADFAQGGHAPAGRIQASDEKRRVSLLSTPAKLKSIIALTPQLCCAEGYGYLFLTPKKPMLLCWLMLQMEAGVLL
jgi:hypothetical protein